MRGSRDPSGQSLERARENGMEKDAERTDGEGIYGRRGKAAGLSRPRLPRSGGR